MSAGHAIVLTTVAAGFDASALAARLVEERLAACVNVLPEMESTYRWEGRIQRDRERQVIVKTTVERLDQLKKRIAELHSYDVPELVVVPIVDGSAAYLSWLSDETSAPKP